MNEINRLEGEIFRIRAGTAFRKARTLVQLPVLIEFLRQIEEPESGDIALLEWLCGFLEDV